MEFDSQAPNLTHEHLLKQASSVAVNAASQLLTQTVVALVNIVDEYSLAIHELMRLLEEGQSKIKVYEEDELDELLVASRARVDGIKTQLIEIQSFLEYVEKMVVSTAETSYLAGAEYVSSTLSERLHSAKFEVGKCLKQVEKLDNDLLIMQKDAILDYGKNKENASELCVRFQSMTLPPIAIDTSDHSQNDSQTRVRSSKSQESCRSESQTSSHTSGLEICRICHCEGDSECGLIAPCYCSGSLRYVHQTCLQQWIKSSNIRSCELCKFQFIMQTKTKPFLEWEPLEMTGFERRKLICAVMFHAIAITCVVWSLYVLIHRTAEEIQYGLLEWPFWTKLIVVAIGFTGGVVFMYIQCKAYMQICQRWKAFNRVIYVQNAPEKLLIPTISSPANQVIGTTGSSNAGSGTASQQKAGDIIGGNCGSSGIVSLGGGGKVKPHPDTSTNTNFKDETSIDLKGVRNLHIFFNDESLRVQNDQYCGVDEGDANLEGVTVAPSGVQRSDDSSSTSWHIKIGKGSGSDSNTVVQQRSGESETKASASDSMDTVRNAKGGDEFVPCKNSDGATVGGGSNKNNDSVLKLQIKKAEIVIKFGQKNNSNGEPSGDESLLNDRKDTSVNIKIDDKENDPIVIDVVKTTQQTEKDPVQIRFDFSQNDAEEATSTLIQSTYSENSTSETESGSHSPLLAAKPYASSDK